MSTSIMAVGSLMALTKCGSSILAQLSLPFLALLHIYKKENPHDVACQSHRMSQPLLDTAGMSLPLFLW